MMTNHLRKIEPGKPAQHQTRRASATTLASAAALALMLGACAKVDRVATGTPSMPDGYHERHPIVLAEAPMSLDIFPAGRTFSQADQLRIRQFAELYRETGKGQIVILQPAGGRGAHSAGTLGAIRASLAGAGVQGNVRVGTYAPDNQELAAPVRLSFIAVRAKVATRCGEWPDDLASASSVSGWQNQQYWNFGCSTQNMIAQQVADPRDLAGPRGETPSDVNMRMRAIGNVRRGNDPGTKWQVRNANIGGIGN